MDYLHKRSALQKLEQFFRKKYGIVLSQDELKEAYNSLLSYVEAQIAYYFSRTKKHD